MARGSDDAADGTAVHTTARRKREACRSAGPPVPGRAASRLVALLPAHNEQESLPAALRSLWAQTAPPDRVLVVADNCSDATVEVARAHGAEVFITQHNVYKKAGALNQALARLLPLMRPDDLVLVMDADSQLDPGFLAGARRHLQGSADLGGVGGTFRGGPGGGLLGTFQRNEYARYARDVRRLKGKALVLTGTASVFPVRVLREVRAARGAGCLPDRSGANQVYDVHVLTEDNELSQALMHLGYRILAPRGCTLTTEVMTTWRELARQRLRWKRGALENMVDYGLTRITVPYWGRQVLSAIGVLATVLYIGSLLVGVFVGMNLHPFWLGASVVFAAERVVTVHDRGRRQMVLAAPLVIEMVYDVFLQLVQACAFLQAVTRSEKRW